MQAHSFNITLPPGTTPKKAALNIVNMLRAQVGLPPLRRLPKVKAAKPPTDNGALPKRGQRKSKRAVVRKDKKNI